MRYLISVADFIDQLSELTGRTIAWLVLAMVLIICYDVTMRFIFLQGSVALQELEWHMFSLVFLLGCAYTLKNKDHVCVDMLYHSKWMTEKHRAWVGLLGGLLFLVPFCLLIIISSLAFVETSFNFSEGSPDPGGLPYRYILKAVIPVSFALLLLQGIAAIIRDLLFILDKEEKTS